MYSLIFICGFCLLQHQCKTSWNYKFEVNIKTTNKFSAAKIVNTTSVINILFSQLNLLGPCSRILFFKAFLHFFRISKTDVHDVTTTN